MRVELINPNNPTNAANIPFLQKGLLSWTAKAYSPPLNLAMIAAYTPPNIDVSITDECASPIDFEKGVDLVGLNPKIPRLPFSSLTCPHGQYSCIAGMQYLIGDASENPPANPRASVG